MPYPTNAEAIAERRRIYALSKNTLKDYYTFQCIDPYDKIDTLTSLLNQLEDENRRITRTARIAINILLVEFVILFWGTLVLLGMHFMK